MNERDFIFGSELRNKHKLSILELVHPTPSDATRWSKFWKFVQDVFHRDDLTYREFLEIESKKRRPIDLYRWF